jgi:hypothetical protein
VAVGCGSMHSHPIYTQQPLPPAKQVRAEGVRSPDGEDGDEDREECAVMEQYHFRDHNVSHRLMGGCA